MENEAERPVLAVDLGGTQIRAALITPDLEVHGRRAEPTRDEEGVDAVLRRIADLAATVRREATANGLPEPIGLGISSPGPLDPWRGVVLMAPNLAGWTNVPVAERLSDALELPAFLERDTNVAVTAEWRYGAATGTRNAIYITVSTGIGGGVIIDGHPLRGTHGTAGEVGHIVVELDGPRCGCGGFGHVEAIASGTALARDARAMLDRDDDSPLARLAASGEEVDAELVARAAAAGDSAAMALLDRAFVAIGALCASLVNLLDPEVIVIGGSIAEHHPRLFEVARAELRRRAFPILVDRIRIEPAALGGDVSLIGLLPIVNDRIGDPAFMTGSHRPPAAALEQGAGTS
ncbi:MAG TPA: ROK family protein [Candidatus Limnocylindria bacterium]|nr:ROK family protein [Candidatus Limnocylindria bacterium]